MKLIVGLGNPEAKYARTRHNVGFFAVEKHAVSKGASFQPKNKFKAQVAEYAYEDEKAVLVLPTTYYNLSGEAVRAVADFYKIAPEDILVVHDELALPFGTVRTRIGGSDAGNNGVKSVTQHMGPDTARIRIGVWNELRDRMDDADFVLGTFSQQEQQWLEDNSSKISALIDSFVLGTFEATTHR